jgi:hypothetical protein
MKSKVFLIVCIGSTLMMLASSVLLFSQLRSVKSINLDPLVDKLSNEDASVLSWILSSIPIEKLNTLKLPESWAEIFVVNNSDLQVISSTNQAHLNVALYQHPLLLDQGSTIVNAIKTRIPTKLSTKEYMVVIKPVTVEQTIISLKPKSWEKSLVKEEDQKLKTATSGIVMILGIFVAIGACITFVMAFFISKTVVTPTSNALEAFEALSLGELDYDIKEASGKEMGMFIDSYYRLKTTLEMALERISRR